MIVNSSTLAAMQNSFKALFIRGLQGASSDWKKVASEYKSSGASTIYGWLNAFPKFREWIGPRVIKDMKTSDYSLVNKKFEATVGVEKTNIEDDQIGIYSPMMEQMGQSAIEHIDENVFKTLADGFTGLCYDGKPFFSTEHPLWTNVDGTGTNKKFSNIINPTNTTGDAWFLLDASKPIKPLVYQNRKDAEFNVITSINNDKVFMTDTYLYGADARRAFGYSIPQLAVACRDTLNAANFEAAYTALLNMQTDGERPLNLKASVLVVPPSLRAAAVNLINKEVLAGGESNVNYKIVDVVVSQFAIPTPTESEVEEETGEAGKS